MHATRSTHRTADLLDHEPHLGHPVSAAIATLEDLFPPDAAFSVLDAGCGFGHLACGIAEKFPACEVQGVDLEPEVLSAARKRAVDRGLATRVHFCARRLSPGQNPSKTFDVLVFLAAQQVFRDPLDLNLWLQAFGKPQAIGLVDRAAVVLPGRELAAAAQADHFRQSLGSTAQEVHSHNLTLSREASLQCVDLLMEHSKDPRKMDDLPQIRQRLSSGALAQARSELYLVRLAT
jgi:SAM-dependent methyltransferase